MSVRFIASRAGCGKTAYCLDAVRDRLRESATQGPRLVLLVPEQAALQTERALIETPDVAGYTRCEVLSFRRLAFRVLTGSGGTGREEVSALSRLMVLRYLIGRRKRSLRVFDRVADRGGFVCRLADQLVELFVQGVEPDDLQRAAEQADTEPESRSWANKLHDLTLLYTDYLTYLGDGRIDVDQYLEAARGEIDKVEWLRGADVWVDGFAIFSRQEEGMLAALARVAGRMEITFLADPESSALAPRDVAPEPGRLFFAVEDTIGRLTTALRDAGVALDPPHKIMPKTPPRFARSPALAALERDVFTKPPVDETSRRVVLDRYTVEAKRSIRIVEAATRRVEVDICLAEIQSYVQRAADPLRYRDIAVIVRNMEPYHDLLSAAFDAHEIPYFIDRRRPVAHHPLMEIVRIVTSLCVNDLDETSVRLLLKTGLTGLTWDEADVLENYVLAHGIRARRMWLGDAWTFPIHPTQRWERGGGRFDETAGRKRVHRSRQKLIAPLRAVLEMSSHGQKHTGREWAAALFQTLEQLRVPEQLEHWSRAAEANGRLDEAEEHRQVWRDAMELLDAFVASLGDESMPIRRFGEVLETGLSQFTLGLAPPSLDQVLVGAIERSRHPDIRAAIVLGFNEGMFPTIASDRGVLTETENERMRAGDIRLGRGREMRLDQERLLAYIAVTRPRERLTITYAAADEDGKALAPSPYIPFVLGALDERLVEIVREPADAREHWNVGSAGTLAGRLALEIRQRPPDPDKDSKLAARRNWNALYVWARSASGCPGLLQRALSGLAPVESQRLTANAVQSLYGGDRPWSVTQLEAAAWCPFKHFGQFGLRLRERAEHRLAPVDLGRLHHAILEDVINALIADGKRPADLDESEFLDRVTAAADRQCERLAGEHTVREGRHEYLIRRTVHDLRRATAAQRTVNAAGRFRPVATELAFGYPDRSGGLPALEIDTPGGRRVRLRGLIDRVDVAEDAGTVLGIVIDYKRGGRDSLRLDRVLAGLDLQLLTYLLVLDSFGKQIPERPQIPTAAFYFQLRPQYELVSHPSKQSDRERRVSGTYRPRGVLSAEGLSALDTGLESGHWSEAFQARLKNDGAPGNIDVSDVADRPQLAGLLAAAREQLGRLADQVLDGEVAVRPAVVGDGLPCRWCSYMGVCRFEPATDARREIRTLTRTAVFEQLGAQT